MHRGFGEGMFSQTFRIPNILIAGTHPVGLSEAEACDDSAPEQPRGPFPQAPARLQGLGSI